MSYKDRSPPPSSAKNYQIDSAREQRNDLGENAASLKRKMLTRSPGSVAREEAAKRQRTDSSDSPERHGHDHHLDYERRHPQPQATDSKPTPTNSPSAPANRRRTNIAQEEKKRGQRLFGSLLSTLSQRSPTTQQHLKRLEIEKRQHERGKKHMAEVERLRVERLAKVKSIRKAEQIKLDEEMMHSRHRNELAMAHHLKTKSNPPLYYLPCDLSRDQEDEIHHQVERARVRIDSEVEFFGRRRAERREAFGRKQGTSHSPPPPPPPPPPSQLHEERQGERDHDSPPKADESRSELGAPISVSKCDATAKKSPTSPPGGPPRPSNGESSNEIAFGASISSEKGVQPHVHGKDHTDDSGDVVFEAEEDTVIY